MKLVAAGRVVFFFQGLALDLDLPDPPLQLVDLLGHRIDGHPDPRGGLIHQVDGLVREKPGGDVPVGERRRGDQSRVLDLDAVVDLVLFLKAAEDRDRVLDRRLPDHHRLEPPLQGGVLFDMLAVLVDGRRPDAMKLAPGQGRLEEVRGVHRPLGRAGPDDRVKLVDEQDDVPFRFLDFLEDGLQPVLELAPELRPG